MSLDSSPFLLPRVFANVIPSQYVSFWVFYKVDQPSNAPLGATCL